MRVVAPVCPEKPSLSGGWKLCERHLIAETPELLEAAALEAFSAKASEIVSTEFVVSGGFCHQVVSDLENMAADRKHCASMPYVCA